MSFWVYIVASQRNGTIYTGVTRDLPRRIYLHKQKFYEGFTKKYGVHRLVYIESHDLMTTAIQREKNIKRWYRKWKVELIETTNPRWDDLYETLNW